MTMQAQLSDWFNRLPCDGIGSEHWQELLSIVKPPEVSLSAEVISSKGYSGETESSLVLVMDGRKYSGLFIPEELPDEVLEAALAKLNT